MLELKGADVELAFSCYTYHAPGSAPAARCSCCSCSLCLLLLSLPLQLFRLLLLLLLLLAPRHRVGRAGRFGTKGLALTFVATDEDQEARRTGAGASGQQWTVDLTRCLRNAVRSTLQKHRDSVAFQT